jgi:hypothetical protein
MCDNSAFNNLTGEYNSAITGVSANSGQYWREVGISAKDLAIKLVYADDVDVITSNWDYGITLNEDDIKVVVEKITKERELDKITPNNGPEIPKWTGFLPI